MIVENFLIADYKIYSIWIFTAVGLIVALFTLWHEGKKDGFDQEHILDLFFISLFVFVFSYKLGFDYLIQPEYGESKFLLSVFVSTMIFIFTIIMLARLWNWSIFRTLDIFSMAAAAFLSIYILGNVLISKNPLMVFTVVMGVVFYYLISRYRNVYLKSGLAFSLFTFVCVILGVILARNQVYLLFYFLFFTIGLLNYYFRATFAGKEALIFKPKLHLRKGTGGFVISGDLFNFLKSKLLSKDKRLKAEQKLLLQTDPYMQEDRATGNSEDIDEVMLEDNRKELFDVQKSALEIMRTQVKKALAIMKIGKYGMCEVCGQPIDSARLKVYPEATKCIVCENDAENGKS